MHKGREQGAVGSGVALDKQAVCSPSQGTLAFQLSLYHAITMLENLIFQGMLKISHEIPNFMSN